MENETISLREFSRRTGVSDKTIRDGIKTGKISKGVIYENDKPKIIYDIAIIEFNEIGLGYRSRLKKDPPASLEQQKEPEKVKVKKEPRKIEEDVNDNEDEDDFNLKVDENISLAEAQRLERVFTAKLKELEYRELNKSLAKISDVYAQLFEFGKEMRSELESIPKRMNLDIELEHKLSIIIRDSLSKLIDNLGDKKIN